MPAKPIRQFSAVVLALVIAGCVPVSQHDSTTRSSDISRQGCLKGQDAKNEACPKPPLPNPISTPAPDNCDHSNQADSKNCRATLQTGHRAEEAAGAPTPEKRNVKFDGQGARRYHAMAEALYKATSRDAETFTAAALILEIRRKVETVMGRKLTNEQLQKLAGQARAEALYWYKYMQGLERTR